MNINALPGTNIQLPGADYSVRSLLSSLFLAGGLMLSQVSCLTDFPPYVLQNWVKRGFVPPPLNKKYSQGQFCRIAIINALKDSLHIDIIIRSIHYAAADDTIAATPVLDDTELYCYFVEALLVAENDINKLDATIHTTLTRFVEPYPGARERLRAVIKAMCIAYMGSRMKNSAELLIANLGLLDS